ncbi:hypothetical protein TrVGV298_003607 [Trichoderma virens]|nr:hypothetical protein TrVGV298_003607 [Trichoderma virens]
MEAAVGTSKNVGRIVTTGVKSPMNFCLGLAKGFRNIPRLYNDDTVRDIEKVTDFNSGVRVASKELGFGLYDGISGLLTQPMRGAQKEGAAGLIKGVGKGIGGLIAKPAAGFWGLPAYVMQGAYAELNKFLSRSVQNYIITSRVVQGERDLQNASEGEKADIISRWKQDADLASVYQKNANSQEREDSRARSGGGSSSWRFSPQEARRQLVAALSESKPQQKPGRTARRSYSPVPRTPDTASAIDTEYEAAIRASVVETSRGDAEEDAMIEAAIRESVKAMRQQGSLPDPVRLPLDSKHHDIFEDEEYKITDEEYQNLIEQAIRESMIGHVGDFSLPSASGAQELDAVDTAIPAHGDEPRSSASVLTPTSDEDADLQRAIEESRKVPPTLPPRTSPSQEQEDGDEDEHFRRAIEASKDEMERARHERTEEEIVMEYVKKQSLAEEEFRKQQLAKGKGKEVSEATNDGDDDDEELKKAIEESLKMSGGSSSAQPSS